MAYVGALSGDLFDAFIGAAKRDAISEKYSFLHTSDESCAGTVGTTAPGVGATRRFDDSPVGYTGAASSDDIVAWAKATAVPKLITFSEDFIEPIFADHNPALILFTEETGTGYQGVFSQAAGDLQGEILFVTSGVTDGIQSRLAEFIGVTKDDLPTLRLISPQDQMLKYVWEGDVTALTGDDIKSYIESYKAGSLKPHLKSEPVPENNNGPVTTIVGKNWEEIVMDESKDVLVKYYAPWCGHCKALAPTWDELGVHVKDVADLVIADFDATVNEVAGLEIRGYPTLKWYPKGGKAGSDYGGGREIGDFKTWLAENSSAYKAGFPAAQEEL
jgi:protein disulfide-isomerase A1